MDDGTTLRSALFEASGALLLGIDAATGEIVEANERASEVLGQSQADLLGSTVSTATGFTDLEAMLARVPAPDASHEFTTTGLHPDGAQSPAVTLTRRPVAHDRDEYIVLTGQVYPDGEPDEGESAVRWNILEDLIEQISDAAFVHDEAGRFRAVNQAAIDLLGYAEDELLGADPSLFDPAVSESHLGPRLAELEREESVQFEATYVTASGEEVPVEITSSLLSCTDQRVIVSVARNLQAKKQRIRNRELAETLFEDHREATFIVDVDEEFTIERVNPAYEEASPLSAADIEGKTPREIFGAKRGGEIADRYRRCVENRESLDVEQTLEMDGRQTHWWTRLAPVVVEDEVQYIVGSTREITDRKNRERQIETHLREAQRIANITSWYYDLRDVSGNERFTGEKFMGQVHPADRDRVEGQWERVLESGGSYDIEYRVKLGAEIRWMREKVESFSEPGHAEPVEAIGVVQDITDRKERELELERYELFLESIQDAVTVIDAEGRLQYESPGIEAIVGQYPSGRVGADAFEFIHPADRELVREEFTRRLHGDQSVEPLEYRIRTTDGSWTWVESRGQALLEDHDFEGLVVTSRDVSAQKEQQRQLDTLISNLPGIVYRCKNEQGWPMELVRGRAKELTGYTAKELVSGAVNWEEALVHPEDRARVREQTSAAVDAGRPFTVTYRIRTRNGEEKWLWEQGQPVTQIGAQEPKLEGFITDITDRKRREQELERRSQRLHELVGATRELLTAKSKPALYEGVIDAVWETLSVARFAVLGYDEAAGVLRAQAVSPAMETPADAVPPIEPGQHSIWESYRAQETDRLTMTDTPWAPAEGTNMQDLLVVPIGAFGLLLVGIEPDTTVSADDRQWLELIATNAAAILERIEQEHKRRQADEQLQTQQTRTAELTDLLNAVEAIQRRFAESDTREELEASVCEEVVRTDPVDFAWIGRPEANDAELTPAAWAGEDRGYLDAIDTTTVDGARCPAQQAADDHRLRNVSQIPRNVPEQPWATQALTGRFRSVLAIPLEQDDVLYGVLTVFSRQAEAFGDLYESLLADVGSLLATSIRTVTIRNAGAASDTVEVEFSIQDPQYPLYRVAERTDSEIRFETILATTDGTVTELWTVLDGDPEAVFEAVQENTKIVSADWFGAPEHGQLTVEMAKPMLADGIRDHGGRLAEAIGTPTGATVTLVQTAEQPVRPIIAWVSTQYTDVELTARRTRTPQDAGLLTSTSELLTDRQREILRAAYYGGYYETPKQITGEELGTSFDISRPAVYKHLQAAQRKLLRALFDDGATLHS
ncbi:PAS sensor histidine kinase [Halodesulfurarchaeum formicicum]|uniref:histidine kinase n=1 Tax=Halodesulfurarchaeum formicicum TaxID=1873524 RepID=A0A1D8S667_9EURY|nr:PAS domain S-box protein [Halodesulfurarchaeum formicicum]AOW80855.1 PAS sensor histidine kinase [Halodesulfurarchaeum formicicum]